MHPPTNSPMTNAAYFSQVVEQKKKLNQSCVAPSRASPMAGPNQSMCHLRPPLGNLNNLPLHRPLLNKECHRFLAQHFPDESSWGCMSAQLFVQLLLKQYPETIDSNLAQYPNILMEVQSQLVHMLSQPNGNLDLPRLASLTRDTGLLGLLVNCLREITEHDTRLFYPQPSSPSPNDLSLATPHNLSNFQPNHFRPNQSAFPGSYDNHSPHHPQFQSQGHYQMVTQQQHQSQQKQLQEQEEQIAQLQQMVEQQHHHHHQELEETLTGFCAEMFGTFEKTLTKKVRDQERRLKEQADHVTSLLAELENRAQQQGQLEELQQALQDKDQEIAQLKKKLDRGLTSEEGMQISGDQFLIEKCVDFIKEVNQGLLDFGVSGEGMLNIQSQVLLGNIEEIYLNAFQIFICLLNTSEHYDFSLYNWTGFLQLFHKLTIFLFDLKFRRTSRSTMADPALSRLVDYQINEQQEYELVYSLAPSDRPYALIGTPTLQKQITQLTIQKILHLQKMINGELSQQHSTQVVFQKQYYQMILLVFSQNAFHHCMSVSSIIEDLQQFHQFPEHRLDDFLIKNHLVTLIMHLLKKVDGQPEPSQPSEEDELEMQEEGDDRHVRLLDSCLHLVLEVGGKGQHLDYIKQVSSMKNIELLLGQLHPQNHLTIVQKVLQVLRNLTQFMKLQGNFLNQVNLSLQTFQEQLAQDYAQNKPLLQDLDVIRANLAAHAAIN